ncbi:MAG: hypothetical protein Q8Q28_15820 [Pseudomonadota bacterium]|nr:hypothetical protein [Pseudomonadota bacterium]
MTWRHGLSKKDVQWWKWESAIGLGGVFTEGTRVIVQWRPAVGAAQVKINCGIFYRNERVHALDVDQDGQHTNKVGQGRPLFGQRIGPGTHEHTWSEGGYGYAEPLPDFTGFSALFAYFCDKANLEVKGGFKAPPSEQLNLPLL